ncbi:hypothetical protein GGD66_002027 [Bradyrhizobium sp. CIR48]|uniref:hypothetical protein n=1 Tax=Bradyrhizobium sp. CIR48 TaxID=2663840 RepID=UPI001606725D|nr:hypothetical protein [Bradyrhizobium sp. CIR48]MBB4423487.1 hypothetical protein [Bradyrhizobium sp. CIR48]
MRILGQIVVGLLILTVAFVLLGVVQFPVLMLAFVAPTIAGLMNFVWFAVMIGLVIYGMARSKPGLALSPLVFIAIWAGASVVGQWRLQKSIDPKVWDRPISPEASAQRTLIVKSPPTVDNKIVADGRVDRLIKLRLDSSNQKISSIEEVSLARGDACSAEEKQASQQLQNERRSDECFKWRSLAEIPDGLVIEQFYRIGVNNGGSGCCNETQARLRTGGQERPLFSWYQGQAYVLSYFPLFGFFSPSTRPWEIGSGISHPVRYGLDEIDSPKMISAIYGVTPPYASDRGGPVPLATLSASETLDQAQTFAKLANVSPKSVAAMLIAARDKGIVDQRSIDAATSLVGRESEGWTAVTDFAKGLTNDQTALLVEKVVQRLETPGICDECIASQSVANPSLREWKLSERLPSAQALLDRVIRIFVEHHDLATWQYEGCLRIITSLGPQGYPAARNYMYKSVRPLIFFDDTLAYSDKAIAMLRGTHDRPSNEVVRLAAKFDLVRDRDLKEYMTRIWSGELTSLPQRNASPETYAIATKACARIARISDPVLRAEKFGVDCPVPQSSRAPK